MSLCSFCSQTKFSTQLSKQISFYSVAAHAFFYITIRFYTRVTDLLTLLTRVGHNKAKFA